MIEEMVDVIPRKGIIVKPVILHEILQMIDVRMVNEAHCARLAADRADGDQIQKMSAVLAKAERAIVTQDIHSLMTLDREFHLLLAAASQNFELTEILRRLNERSLRFWFISFNTPDHHQNFQRQHEAVFDAVRRHDPDAAEDAMRIHIEAFRKSVMRHL
jgi:DNA-binding GntR family transcriptional regulator